MKPILRDILTALVASAIVVFTAVYGGHPSLEKAATGAMRLVWQTLCGQNLTQNYWSVSGFELASTLQLVFYAILFAVVIGAFLAFITQMIRWRFLKRLLDGVITVLESVPDTMYVTLAVAAFLVLFEHFNIDLPLFGGSFHPTLADTVIPALSIALPGALQIRRLVVERLDEELQAKYVVTAIAKGSSQRRTLVHHILPNVGSTFVDSVSAAAFVVFSSLLFCTFFFQYHDLFFKFSQAVGWNQQSGMQIPGHFMGFVPTYQTGTVALIGLVLVLFWFLTKVLTRGTKRLLFPGDSQVTSAFLWDPMRKFWIVAGALMLAVLLLFGTFPRLLTSHTPQEMVLGPPAQPFPLPASLSTPFGTDDVGHDLFSTMLYGTWGTLLSTAGIALLVTLFSFLIALIAVATNRTKLQSVVAGFVRSVQHLLSALPGFLILFLVLYPRNQAVFQASLHHDLPPPVWRQNLLFLFWLVVFETAQGASTFLAAMDEWRRFTFMQGVRSVGKPDFRAYLTSLRPWVLRFCLSFVFGELSRVLSLMTQLAAFTLFLAVKVGYLRFVFTPHAHRGLVAVQSNWLSTLGAIVNQYTFISYPILLYGPLAFILMAMLASNFIARGIRGGSV